MSRLDRYVLGQVARPMAAIVVIALLVLLAERTLRVLDIVLGWRGSLLVLFEMLSYLVPHYMGIALPASFFIAILLVFSRMSRDGELDGIYAAGFGPYRILVPLFAIGALLAVLNGLVLSHLQPWSRYAYRAALFALSNVSFLTLLRERTFLTLAGTTYRVETLSPERDRFTELLLFSRLPGGETLVITARRGRILPARDGQPIMLDLEDGVQQFVPAERAGAERAPPPATVRFRNFRTDVRGGEPKPFRPRGADERELTLPELAHALRYPPRGIEPFEIAAELHGRLARIGSTLLLPLVALPLAIARRRAKRSYGIVVGIALLVGYNQLLQFGESLADNGKISPWLGLWVPFSLFFLLGAALVAWKTRRVPRESAASRFDLWVERLEQALLRRFGRGAEP
ncbi:MAG: LptF/LptG family permease [Geminicoccaceae bacterium]|nr:LptF/LptG family permease [Geminicoccaceae bacterium]